MVLVSDHPSPNHDARPGGRAIDLLLLHYTGMETASAALQRLCDPAAKVSAHYFIDEDGRCLRLVPEHRRAWHAGVACWAGDSDINGCSIGIELVNPGHEFGYRAFPEAQMAALIELGGVLRSKYRIPAARVIGHADVAPLRKQDPGELFDWPRLAAAGLGLWPGAPPAIAVPPPAVVAGQLTALGYGYFEQDPAAVLRAFQRHFRPAAITGEIDGETAARLARLVDLSAGTP